MLYVDDDVLDSGDGFTWATAHRFVQDALDAARNPNSGVREIRIAQGEYKPDQGLSVAPLDKHASFWIPGGLTVAGGYAGISEPNPDLLDIAQFVTTFSGDLLGDDGPLGAFINDGDNSLNIAQIESGKMDAVVSGVRFIRSQAQISTQNEGGAIRCEGGGLVAQQCTFEGNESYRGGAITVRTARATFIDCAFSLNRSTSGGALYASQSSVDLVDCVFSTNIVQSSGGGAILCAGGTQLAVSDCNFLLNRSSPADGGAIFIASNAEATFDDCLFHGNNGDYGGAIKGPLAATQCDFIQNAAFAHGAIDAGLGSIFKRCRFLQNVSEFGSGAVRTFGGSFIECEFGQNESIDAGGGAVWGSGTFVNCDFNRNVAQAGGGAVLANSNAGVRHVNTTFRGNQSFTGASAVHVLVGLSLELRNCSLFGNSSGAGAAVVEGPAIVTNSIIWGHTGPSFLGATEVSRSCVQGGWTGEGNIDADPLLANALGDDLVAGTGDDDLRLANGSPCIDSGDNSLVPADTLDVDGNGNVTESIPWDMDGMQRVVNDPRSANTGLPLEAQTLVDRGAYEYRDFRHVIGDVTQDGIVNINDLLEVLNSWGACPHPPLSCPADEAPVVDGGDGMVNLLDLWLVLETWSTP